MVAEETAERIATLAALARAYQIAIEASKEFGPMTAYGAAAVAKRIAELMREVSNHG